VNVNLTGSQIQWLIDKFEISVNLEEGIVVAENKNGNNLKASTIAKMVGLKETPPNWREENGKVRGL
jgi:hypothetical protein